LGYTVLTAAGVDEALELFEQKRPSIVLTDIKMPGRSGLDLLRLVKSRDPDVEVLMLTGHGDVELAVQSLKNDATDFLTKPVNDQLLEHALGRAAERLRMRRELRDYARNLENKVREQSARLVEAERQLAVMQAMDGLSSGLRSLSHALADEAVPAPAGEKETYADDMFNLLPCFLAMHDSGGRIVGVNRLFRERLGDLTGQESRAAYARQAYGDPDEYPVGRVLASGVSQRANAVFVDKKGAEAPVSVYAVPICNNEGEVELVLELAVDAGEVRRLREELRLTRDHLSQLGMLLGSTAHGIKGLLTALDGSIYRMGSGLKMGKLDRAEDGFRDIRLLVGKLRRMVLDILHYAKERPPVWETLDLAAFAEENAAIVEGKATELGVALERDFCPDGGLFEADAGSLSSALVNILDNAVEACAADPHPPPEGGRVVFSTRAEAAHIALVVKDNGPGLDQKSREKLFTLFYSSKGSAGAGIGLFVAAQAVRQHGGAISVDSEPGQGAVFTLRLPRRRPEARD
jgi:signal transduction histidine kinase/CheY-like chemotaxis protein